MAYWVGGAPRVCFSFFLGIALFRLWQHGKLAPLKVPAVVLVALLWCTFLPPAEFQGVWLYDVAIVMLVFPLIIASATNIMSARFAAVCSISGQLSYPIYILQSGIMPHMRGLPEHLHLHGISAIPVIGAEIAMFIGFSWLVLKFYDEPLRAWLTANGRRSVSVMVS